MTPEEKAREKIDKQLKNVGWDVVARNDYIPNTTSAIKEALMVGNNESDYLLFVDNKAIAVVEAKREENTLAEDVAQQAEGYAVSPQNWYGLWEDNIIPLVYLANGNKIYFKNMLTNPDGDYVELNGFHSPKKMLQLIGKFSEYGALPLLNPKGLRNCQYNAEIGLEKSFKEGKKKALAVLATGSGKTYLACLASYRLLNYTPVKRILFLVDRNNLARQTESEFSLFDRTEKDLPMSGLYNIKRLRKNEDIKGDIVISTIQKLFAVLIGQQLTCDDNEDAEDELTLKENDKKEKDIVLGDNLMLPPDYFQFIIVDECHRSIYGKWQSVLKYFSNARIMGLTATPTPEAYAFFDENIIEKYTYEDSIVDGVNVPNRVYRIKTQVSEHGGTIKENEKVIETNKRTSEVTTNDTHGRIDYSNKALDRSVTNPAQIEIILKGYRDAIYTELYPDRNEEWAYIPKTLIFAKDDNHATQIMEGVGKVFGEKFANGNVPAKFVQKITYSSGDSNTLIRDFKEEKDFRIAVTVTLVATGTDVRPLEVVFFMNDVRSDVLYTQMKGRGCRVIADDKLKEVTPNATTKECFYIVDATGVTENDKTLPAPGREPLEKRLSLEHLLEHLSHYELSDENIVLLLEYCATIHKRYENDMLFGKHLDSFIRQFNYSPRNLADKINQALKSGNLPPFISPSSDNSQRMTLISGLIYNLEARDLLLQLQRGYRAFAPEQTDEIIETGFTKETARNLIDLFEQYLKEKKDAIEALRIIYNSEDTAITHDMLVDLKDKLLSANREFTTSRLWDSYKLLDVQNSVEKFDHKNNTQALTHLIQIVRYAYRKTSTLTSLFGVYAQRFNLYCGQAQRTLTEEQQTVLKQIADYIVREGSVTPNELNNFDTELWKRAMITIGGKVLAAEMQKLSKFILKAA